jgi:phosphoglycolate phosphatase
VRPTVLLFDIDGTLISAGGAGRRAVERAFLSVCGRADSLEGVAFNGLTDPIIVRAGLERLGLAPDAERVDAILAAYLAVLPDELARATAFHVKPGVEPLLGALAGRDGVAVGLGTGNLRAGAMLKLARGGLHGHFAFGGYGCDHAERAELLRVGARRGADRLGVPVDACRVVVIGDTPRDVAAARAIGAACIGVGTGGCTPAALREAGADLAIDDLTDARALAALCEGD